MTLVQFTDEEVEWAVRIVCYAEEQAVLSHVRYEAEQIAGNTNKTEFAKAYADEWSRMATRARSIVTATLLSVERGTCCDESIEASPDA